MVPAVLLMIPDALPSTTFDGNAKFTTLNMLKNSARNRTITNLLIKLIIEVFVSRSAERVTPQRSESSKIGPRPARHINRNRKK